MLRWNEVIFIVGVLVLCASGCRKTRIGASDKYAPFTEVALEEAVSSEVTSLRVATLAGKIRVVGGPENKIRIEAEVKIRRTRAKKEAGPGEFADHIRLETQGEELTVVDAHMDQSDKDDWRVSFVIHAPARLAAAVSVTAGEIQVDGMESDLDLRNDAGKIGVTSEKVGSVTARAAAGLIDIRAGSIAGGVEATAAVGSVSLRVTESPPIRDVRLESEAGDVLLELPQDSPGTYRAKSSIGSVSISGREGITVTRSGLGAQAEDTVGEGGPVYELTANVGAVTVR